jgi:PAS domain-containing protein
MYRLKTEMVDRINFEEFQQRAAWEALTGYSREQLADTRNLDSFIAAHWEEAREEIAAQVDDIEEAYAFFMSVWRKEFGLASDAAFQPDEF